MAPDGPVAESYCDVMDTSNGNWELGGGAVPEGVGVGELPGVGVGVGAPEPPEDRFVSLVPQPPVKTRVKISMMTKPVADLFI